jgi:Uma2 family endonuclease
MAALPLQQETFYPESDGRPMAESDLHREEMTYLIHALGDLLRDDSQAYVAGNLFIYYEKGRPRSVVAPDVFLVRGVAKRLRKVYKLWEERVPPCLVIEVTSESTRDEDLELKRDLYERLGVEEYFLYDPTADYLKTRLQGLRLTEGRYQPVPLEPEGLLCSRTAGVTLALEGERVRLIVTETGRPLLRYEELARLQRDWEHRGQEMEG